MTGARRPAIMKPSGRRGWLRRCVLLIGIAWALGGEAKSPVGARSTIPLGECEGSRPLIVHFYDVGQATAALVELPDGRCILVDAGGHRTALEPKLARDLQGRPIDLVWITHPHDDHINQFKAILRHTAVVTYVDNGRDGGSPARGGTGGMGVRMRHAAAQAGARVVSLGEGKRAVPLVGTANLTFTAIAPITWPSACLNGGENDCSLGLRIDYCASSMLFLGDAEAAEEMELPTKPVSLLAVPHHGGRSSASSYLLSRARPRYAVISSGRNSQFCHPSGESVRRLNEVLGGRRAGDILVGSRSGSSCEWRSSQRSDRLWVTATDGDVTLVTVGDGSFSRK